MQTGITPKKLHSIFRNYDKSVIRDVALNYLETQHHDKCERFKKQQVCAKPLNRAH